MLIFVKHIKLFPPSLILIYFILNYDPTPNPNLFPIPHQHKPPTHIHKHIKIKQSENSNISIPSLPRCHHIEQIEKNINWSLVRVVVVVPQRMNMNGFYSFQLLFFYLVIFIWTCFYDVCVSDIAVYEFTVDYFLALDPFTALSIQSMICELSAINHSSFHGQLAWIISSLMSGLLYNHPDSV